VNAAELFTAAAGALGAGLLLSNLRWFRRPPIWLRLQPYVPARTTGGGPERLSATPTASSGWSAQLAALLGPPHRLESRLRRAGREVDPATFRTRQFTAAVVALLAALAAVLALAPPVPMAAALVIGAPALAILAPERRLDHHIAARRHELVVALPVTTEQLGLLVGAGYSLGSALSRLAGRSTGVVADELGDVVRRIRQGRSEVDALREWAADSGLPPVERLVGVLALHREAGDLAALLADETATVRAEAHRSLIETIERRSQLVWVPVTVATLVPGLILLAVPFLSAVATVTGG
jgi:pilus assembly protein TadC